MSNVASQVVLALFWVFIVLLVIFFVSLMAIVSWGTIAYGLEILTAVDALNDAQFARIEQLIGRLWSYVLTAIAFSRLSLGTLKGTWNWIRERLDSQPDEEDTLDE